MSLDEFVSGSNRLKVYKPGEPVDELAARLGIHEATVVRWVKFGMITRHAYNGHAYLYEDPGPNPPIKHSSRWDPLVNRVAAIRTEKTQGAQDPRVEREEV